MKVHLIKKQTIMEFCHHHANSTDAFDEWLDKLNDADWEKPADIKQSYPAADLLGNSSERVIFDIGGNKFRMICLYYFGRKWVQLYIRWIGTHAEYNKLCKLNNQYTV
jgi:mRNA interferase HigB